MAAGTFVCTWARCNACSASRCCSPAWASRRCAESRAAVASRARACVRRVRQPGYYLYYDRYLQSGPKPHHLELKLVTGLLQSCDVLPQSLVFEHHLLVHLYHTWCERYLDDCCTCVSYDHLTGTLQHLLQGCLPAIGFSALLGELHDQLVDDLLCHAGQCNTLAKALAIDATRSLRHQGLRCCFAMLFGHARLLQGGRRWIAASLRWCVFCQSSIHDTPHIG